MSENSALLKYVAKLERHKALPPEDRAALLALPGFWRDFRANETIMAEGVAATHCIVLDSGFASRIKALSDTVQQIVAFHVPGDGIDFQSLLFTTVDHTIHAHSASRTFWISHEAVLELVARHPVAGQAIWLDTLVDASIFREWTANVGQRNARERIAHLILEMAARFDRIGLLDDNTFDLPIAQSAMAQALGLSLVHMNKSLQTLRKEGYVFIQGHYITLTDRDRLVALCGFRDDYLHLDRSRIKQATVRPETRLADA